MPNWERDMNDGTVAMVREALDDAAFGEAWERGAKLTLDQAVAHALDSSE
jgi:hypothetical protein